MTRGLARSTPFSPDNSGMPEPAGGSHAAASRRVGVEHARLYPPAASPAASSGRHQWPRFVAAYTCSFTRRPGPSLSHARAIRPTRPMAPRYRIQAVGAAEVGSSFATWHPFGGPRVWRGRPNYGDPEALEPAGAIPPEFAAPSARAPAQAGPGDRGRGRCRRRRWEIVPRWPIPSRRPRHPGPRPVEARGVTPWTWERIERAAASTPGWRRTRQGEWRGPCKCGGERDRAWIRSGRGGTVLAGCNAGCDGVAVLRWLVGDESARLAPAFPPRRDDRPRPRPHPAVRRTRSP